MSSNQPQQEKCNGQISDTDLPFFFFPVQSFIKPERCTSPVPPRGSVSNITTVYGESSMVVEIGWPF